MKKLILALLIPMVFLVSCSNDKTEERIIYTSIYPIEYITKEIVQDRIKVENIIPQGVEVHSWEPTMKKIASMSDAEINLVIGLGMESWEDTVVNSIGEDKIKEVSSNVDFIKLTDNVDEKHSYDPHIWLSPKNMKIMAENIYKEILEIDSDNKEYYEDNFNDLIGRLSSLDEKYIEGLKLYSNRSIIVPHEAFGYLVRDYNLKQIPIENINSSSEPDLGRIAEIVDLANKEDIKYVFYEYNENKKLSENIAKEIGGDIKEIYTLENISKEQLENNEDYISLMEKNLNNILESFK